MFFYYYVWFILLLLLLWLSFIFLPCCINLYNWLFFLTQSQDLLIYPWRCWMVRSSHKTPSFHWCLDQVHPSYIAPLSYSSTTSSSSLVSHLFDIFFLYVGVLFPGSFICLFFCLIVVTIIFVYRESWSISGHCNVGFNVIFVLVVLRIISKRRVVNWEQNKYINKLK